MNKELRPFLLVVLLIVPLLKSVAQESSLELQKLQLSYRLISTFYVDTVNEEKLVEDALNGMLKNLDPHSEYLSKEEVKQLTEPLDGGFEGVGIQFNIFNDTLMVVSPISGGPSEKVGIQAGDRIIFIDGENVAGIGLKNKGVQDRLKGKKGTKVKLKVQRRGMDKLIDFTVIRDRIPIHSVEAGYMATKDIGYIKINQFSSNTHEEFETAAKKLLAEGMKKMILDLRGNPGGYLRAATDIADELLGNDEMIVYTEGIAQPRREFHASKKGLFENGEVVVLINEGSASASEIVTGAIQDWDRGVVIGRRSFGKGLVQRPFSLQDGSMLKLTVAKYYTPSGRCIQKPYDKGKESYLEEIYHRYDSNLDGHDSISVKRSVYYTKNEHRKVYGGGGITPDILVSIDTTGYSDFYRDLVGLGVINNYILSYVDLSRSDLLKKYTSFEKFNKNFEISDDMIEDLKEQGVKEGSKSNVDELENSNEILKNQLKALIARNLWGVNEYFKVINPTVSDYKKAIEILSGKNDYKNIINK